MSSLKAPMRHETQFSVKSRPQPLPVENDTHTFTKQPIFEAIGSSTRTQPDGHYGKNSGF